MDPSCDQNRQSTHKACPDQGKGQIGMWQNHRQKGKEMHKQPLSKSDYNTDQWKKAEACPLVLF